MTKQLRALLQKLEAKKQEIRSLLDQDKVSEATAQREELRKLQDAVDAQRAIDEDEYRSLGGKPLNGDPEREELLPGEVRALTLEQRMADFSEPFVVDGEERKLSVGKFVRGIVTGNWQDAVAERRAMSEGVLSDGGYTVPTQLSSTIIDLARNQARVLQAGALTVPMDTNKLTIARVLTDPTVHWKKENDSITESGMTFDAINFNAKTLVGMARLSVELIEDSANIDQVVTSALSEALALELDRVGLFGSGTDPEPLGLSNVTGTQKISMGTNGGSLEDYSIFSQSVEMVRNMNGEASGLIWAPRTAGTIDRLVDSTGQPLRAPASYDGLRKYATNQIPVDMTKGTANNASIVFVGDWTKLLIGMRRNLVLEVSRQAAGAFEKLQVVIRVYLRADVGVSKPNQFVLIDGITPPSEA